MTQVELDDGDLGVCWEFLVPLAEGLGSLGHVSLPSPDTPGKARAPRSGASGF